MSGRKMEALSVNIADALQFMTSELSNFSKYSAKLTLSPARRVSQASTAL
jgi:hypothetical protein